MNTFGAIVIVIIPSHFFGDDDLGGIMTRQASKSMDHYFLGGLSMPWYLLGIASIAYLFELWGTVNITFKKTISKFRYSSKNSLSTVSYLKWISQ